MHDEGPAARRGPRASRWVGRAIPPTFSRSSPYSWAWSCRCGLWRPRWTLSGIIHRESRS